MLPSPALLWSLLGLLVSVVVGLALVGERTLPFFDGDTALAARAYKTLFVALGGGIMTCLAPLLLMWFVGRLRRLFDSLDAQGWIADLLLHAATPSIAESIAGWIFVVFGAASMLAAAYVWLSGGM